MKQLFARAAMLAVLASGAGHALAAKPADGSYRTLAWEDLMPPGEEERLEKEYQNFLAGLGGKGSILEGSAADTIQQLGSFNVVAELDGKQIRLPGFPVPLDMGSNTTTKEFLLVPYFGACIHSPPPPPNQVLYIRSEKPVALPQNMDPIWVEGRLSTQKKESEIGSAAYTLSLDGLEPYYRAK